MSVVHFPGLASSPWHARAQRLLPRGAGAVLSFELAAGFDAARTAIESLRLFSHLANVGDLRSLAIHPASTTHRQLSAEQLRAGGVGPGLIRLSVGIEGIDDLLADLDRAISARSHHDRHREQRARRETSCAAVRSGLKGD